MQLVYLKQCSKAHNEKGCGSIAELVNSKHNAAGCSTQMCRCLQHCSNNTCSMRQSSNAVRPTALLPLPLVQMPATLQQQHMQHETVKQCGEAHRAAAPAAGVDACDIAAIIRAAGCLVTQGGQVKKHEVTKARKTKQRVCRILTHDA
jgi:hypothetical protein